MDSRVRWFTSHGIVLEESLMSRRVRQLLGYRFTHVDSFELERTSDGAPCRYMPQKDYFMERLRLQIRTGQGHSVG